VVLIGRMHVIIKMQPYATMITNVVATFAIRIKTSKDVPILLRELFLRTGHPQVYDFTRCAPPYIGDNNKACKAIGARTGF
jgi:hypothetical protein